MNKKVKIKVVDATCGAGKAQPLYSDVLTKDGFKKMKDIKVGDKVFGEDGNLYNVTGVYPQGKKDIYEVEFQDGTSTRCCDEHLWTYQLPYDREIIVDDSHKLLVEVNGKQHYEICLHTKTDAVERCITPEEGFKLLQYRDKIKKECALSHNYYYLIIPYWTESDQSYKQLIDNMIHKILSEQI